MKITFFKVSVPLLISMMIIVACNLPRSTPGEAILPPAVNTSPPPTTPPILDIPPTEIQHQNIPINLPAERTNHAGDFDSSTTANAKRAAGGDRFTYERFERPFNSNTMDVYFPHLDIVDTFAYQDETWIFGIIIMKGLDNNHALSGKYGLQLDMDLDGKSDWLIIASNPSSTTWTTGGVQVFQDANHDIGGAKPMFSDDQVVTDGFETLVFDQGKGSDADSAWVRTAQDSPNTVQLALKRSLVENDDTYLMSMWAGTSMMDPALFDMSDHFTHEQAGAADPGYENYYPIKAVAELDNSCRMAIGFEPKGDEPGLCKEFIPVVPGEPPPTEPGVPPPPLCKPNLTHGFGGCQ